MKQSMSLKYEPSLELECDVTTKATKLLSNLTTLVVVKHLCSDFRCQIVHSSNTRQDEIRSETRRKTVRDSSWIQGYLAHKRSPPPHWDYRRALGIGPL